MFHQQKVFLLVRGYDQSNEGDYSLDFSVQQNKMELGCLVVLDNWRLFFWEKSLTRIVKLSKIEINHIIHVPHRLFKKYLRPRFTLKQGSNIHWQNATMNNTWTDRSCRSEWQLQVWCYINIKAMTQKVSLINHRTLEKACVYVRQNKSVIGERVHFYWKFLVSWKKVRKTGKKASFIIWSESLTFITESLLGKNQRRWCMFLHEAFADWWRISKSIPPVELC